MWISVGSLNGRPSISSAIGKPSGVIPAGTTMAGRPVTALSGLSRVPRSPSPIAGAPSDLERIQQHVDRGVIHQVHQRPPDRRAGLQARLILDVGVERCHQQRLLEPRLKALRNFPDATSSAGSSPGTPARGAPGKRRAPRAARSRSRAV